MKGQLIFFFFFGGGLLSTSCYLWVISMLVYLSVSIIIINQLINRRSKVKYLKHSPFSSGLLWTNCGISSVNRNEKHKILFYFLSAYADLLPSWLGLGITLDGFWRFKFFAWESESVLRSCDSHNGPGNHSILCAYNLIFSPINTFGPLVLVINSLECSADWTFFVYNICYYAQLFYIVVVHTLVLGYLIHSYICDFLI